MFRPGYFSDIVPLIVESNRVFLPISAFKPVEAITYFHHGGDGKGILINGWGEPELIGTWSVSQSAKIAFAPSVEGGPLFTPVSLALAFTPFTTESHFQAIRISCNGKLPICVEVPAGEDRLHIVRLEALDRGQPVVIEFDLPDCVAPCTLSSSPDERSLGVQLRWMAVARGDRLFPAAPGLQSAIFVGCGPDHFEAAAENQAVHSGATSTTIFLPGPDWSTWPPRFADSSRFKCLIDFRAPDLQEISGFEELEETGRWLGNRPAQFSFSREEISDLVTSEAHNLVLLLEPFAPPGISPSLFIRTSDHKIFCHRFRPGDRSLRVLRIGPVVLARDKPFSILLRGSDLASPRAALGEDDNRYLAVRLRLACLTPVSAPLPVFTHGMEVAEAYALAGGLESDVSFDSGLITPHLGPKIRAHSLVPSSSTIEGAEHSSQLIVHAEPFRCEDLADGSLDEEVTKTALNEDDTARHLDDIGEQLNRLERLVANLGKKIGGLSTRAAGLSTIDQSISLLTEAMEQARQDDLEREKRMQVTMRAFSTVASNLTDSMHSIVGMVSNSNARQFSVQQNMRELVEQQALLTSKLEAMDWKTLHASILREHRLTDAALRKLDVVARRQVLEVDDHTVALHVEHGYVLVPRRDLRLVLAIHDAVGKYEPGTQAVMAHLLRVGMQAVDVGANVGLHTLCMGRLVGSSGRVWAIEPSEEIAVYLGRTIEANGLQRVVTVLPVAAGDRQEVVVLYVGTTSGLSSLYPLGVAADIQDTQMDRLDNMIPGPIDFVKVDAEGSEINIMEGMGEYIDNHDIAIVAEYGNQHLKKNNLSPSEWFGYFESRGFNCYMINDEGKSILTPKPGYPGDGNYLFVRDASRVSALLER